MSVPTKEKKEIQRETVRFLKEKKREWAHTNDKIWNALVEGWKSGKTDEELYPVLRERFDCGNTRINNVRKRRMGTLSPQAASLTEAKLQLAFQAMSQDLGAAKEEFIAQLEEIDRLEEDGEEFYTRKLVRVTGGKNDGSVTEETVPIATARTAIYKEILDLHDRYWTAVSRIMPKQIDVRTHDMRRVTDEELDDLVNQAAIEAGKANKEKQTGDLP